ncbi:hypothetical protein [Psychrobacillus sp. OK032]|uniref:hypothetical protein n=1 Tax=Psychrobacillus sp. OK032 TaxID=1884358 RepID=UPI0008C79BAA|nr:hypothetical protein [Psychrobacillus sp. OK032]SES03886.1 hypothetical protein SAMN05518872_103361 [Psychrobacillus sp. OK032]
MQMKWKKTGAALLVAGMTLTGATYAWANENLFDTVDLSKLNSNNAEKTTGNSVRAVVTIPENPVKSAPDQSAVKRVETTEKASDLPKIPEGYTAGNLEALIKAYENAGSPTAKAEIKRNIEHAIAKFEASQKVETTELPVVKAPIVETTEKEKAANKEERKALQEKHKAEHKALKEKQKEERKALKEDDDDDNDDHDHKEIKEQQKQAKKALKEKQKAEKHANKKHKKDDKNKD